MQVNINSHRCRSWSFFINCVLLAIAAVGGSNANAEGATHSELPLVPNEGEQNNGIFWGFFPFRSFFHGPMET